MNRTAKQLLLAMTIGDGHIKKTKNELTVSHGGSQIDYCERKAQLLENALDRPVNVHRYNNSGYEAARFHVNGEYLKHVRNWLYKDGVKTLSSNVLSRLTDQGVAIWYQDDGSLHNKKRDGKIHSKELTISTYLEKREEAQVVCDFFKDRYDVDMTVKSNKGRFSVRCGLKEARKLLPNLQPHCFPGMEYKFDLDKKSD